MINQVERVKDEKVNQLLATDRLSELVDYFMEVHKSGPYNKTEMEEENSNSKDNARNMQHTGEVMDIIKLNENKKL